MAGAEPHRDAFVGALIERDSTAARRAIDDALAAGVAIDDIYVGVLQPALY